MRKGRVIISALLLCVVGVALMSTNVTDRSFEISKNLEIFHNIFRDVDMFYVDTVEVEKMLNKGIDAMLATLDPYTEYYPESAEEDLKMMTTGKYAGIGALIRLYPKNDYVAIEEPYEGMPADISGVKAGDLILRIDGEDMKGKTTSYVSDHLRGEPASEFVLTVRRVGVADSMDIKIKRANITLPSVPYYGMWKGAGYILLESFTENCSKDVRKALLELEAEGATSIVLDLRDNGGGLLNEAIEIVSLFVPKGTMVVETKGKTRSASSSYTTRRDPVNTEIPLVVMINGNSASASEIVSGSLQDLDRAVVVGSRSYGKGLVQTTRSLPYNGTLKVTTAKYFIPSGRCIQEIDYSKRDRNGKAERTPDSLSHVFRTKAGREVRDGGGIRPDVTCPVDTLADLIYYLSTDVLLFDYINEFCRRNDGIEPVDEFSVSDSLYDSFKEYVGKSDFDYESRSSQALKAIRDIAKVEGLYANAVAEFDSLETRLQYNVERDLDTFKEDVVSLLGTEIVSRYYYERGVIRYNMRNDAALDSAMVVLGDLQRYRNILSAPELN